MLLSDLIHRLVVRTDGTSLGRVVEVHLVQDGPRQLGGEHRLRVDGLVVGRRAVMARLGLHRPETTGPTLVTWIARAIAGHHDYVPWEQIEVLDEETPGRPITVHGTGTDIPPTS